MLSWQEKEKMISEAIARFPATFKLDNGRSETFRISPQDTYVNDDGIVMLYTEAYFPNVEGGKWLAFAKGTEQELRRLIIK